jgi:hypothetical protein
MKITKYFISILLVFCMVSSLVPMGAMAVDITETDNQKDIIMKVGESVSYTVKGNYKDADTSSLNKDVVSADILTLDDAQAVAWLGADNTYSNSYVDLSECLYTFDAVDGESNVYTIKSTLSNGTVVYLYPNGDGGRPRCPNNTKAANITITNGYTDNSFYLFDGAKYLYFYRDGTNLFNRNSDTSGSAQEPCSFLLFRPAKEDETEESEIKGYVQVESLDQIESGENYLIAALYNNTYYLLHPTTSTTNLDHVARVGSNSELAADESEITFTAKTVGNTSVKIGDTTYVFTVLDATTTEKNITIALGETKTFNISTKANDGVTYPVEANPSVATATVDNNTCSFTGLTLGTTTELVGNVVFNITVVDYHDYYVTVIKGESQLVVCDAAVNSENLSTNDADIAAVAVGDKENTLVFTGVSVGRTSTILDYTKYHVVVIEHPANIVDASNTPFVVGEFDSDSVTPAGVSSVLTKLTISVGCKFKIDLSSSFSDSVVSWQIADDRIASIDSDGLLTANAVGNTYITADIDGVKYTIPLVVVDYVQDSVAVTKFEDLKIYNVQIDEITSSTVYYNFNATTNLVETQVGEAIYVSFRKTDNSCLTFFAKPDDGYVLTLLRAKNTAGDYMSLNGDNAKDTAYYTQGGAAGVFARQIFGDEAVANMVTEAMNLGCDGATGMTRQSTNQGNLVSVMWFRSQKLPTVEKTISKIERDGQELELTSGDITVVENDVIYYNIAITQYATTEAITYSNAVLTDNMKVTGTGDTDRKATFAVNDSNDADANKLNVDKLVDTTLDEDVTYTFKDAVSYTVKAEDIGRELVNSITFDYNYTTQYRIDGAVKAKSNTESVARISAFAFEPDDIIIDFGLPVTVDFSEQLKQYNVTLDNEKFNTKYGSVEITNNKVTYTPTTVLLDSDTIKLTNSIGGTASFKVYPASSVYYEEGFAQYTGSWTETGSKGANPQTTSSINSTANYGYDDSYAAENLGFSNSTSALSKTYGDTATFTFTGTGIEIYGSSIKNQDDLVSVQIRRKSDNKLIKLYAINTALRNGKTTVTDYDDIDKAYSMLLVSNLNLDYDTYTIKIYHSRLNNKTNTFEFDGFRVYGTLEQERGNNVYSAAGEDNAIYAELRDNVLGALSVKTGEGSTAYSKQIENGLSQVYNTSDNTVGAVVVNASDKTDHSYSQANAQDLLDNGPKNELYLYSGQSVVFTIKDTGYKNIQVGMKAVSANASYEIKCGDSIVSYGNITSCTDMYYPVATNASGDTTVTITNTGDGILSLTKIKLAGLSTATASQTSRKVSFARLSAMSFMPALKSLNYISQPLLGDVNSDGTLDVSDATEIQKYLAGYELDNFDKAAADVDSSGNIDIKDATCIQKQLAGLA